MCSQNAISSGSTTAVEELLDHGADVEGTVGQLQTTPLQWALWHKSLDITRLLLQRQASQDRMNMRGWNTVFFLWARLRLGEPSMMDFLNLLAEDSYLDLDIADAQKWTVLDRVAAVGTAKEVRRLIELGANPYQEAAPLRWTAIHQAIFHGNLATFEELLTEYGDTARYMVDDRGWTLLHIAASAGHAKILRQLLKAGGDPDARSKPYDSHMPEVLYGKRCTPQEVAAAQSSEREKQFLDALHEHRLSTGYVMIPSASDSEDEQEFCEAKEYAV